MTGRGMADEYIRSPWPEMETSIRPCREQSAVSEHEEEGPQLTSTAQ